MSSRRRTRIGRTDRQAGANFPNTASAHVEAVDGRDVAGTIDGLEAEGTGRLLKGAEDGDATAGLRVSEVVNLRVGDIDLDFSILKLAESDFLVDFVVLDQKYASAT